MRRRLLVIAATLGFVTSPLPAEAAPESKDAGICEACATALDLTLDNARRAEDRARDEYRHPAETLAFFRVEPGMTVVDYMPVPGWYTRILAPYLGDKGRYIGLNPDVSTATDAQKEYFVNLAGTFPAKAAEWTGLPADRIAAYNTDSLPEELKGTVDRVLIFREMHNLHRFGWLHRELTAMRGLLKDGGMLGIVQHRAKADATAAYTDGNKGYLREKDVIALVEAHGFELVGKSEVNANPRDTADYPVGVWTLPPVLATKADEARYRAIGESDRMTLLFRKRP
ncbi:methyltransferase [Tsuneonella sp. CC-YZS046]|uniref:class I SAM-dependent methyltransferase n=1 Tax=Tsuneonella sp. CC-YZS046 TaxID=3042152 RepID=UPI002D79B588|nr:methyltransferase [Tsuneonella sp. CC-YZS046]WRO65521.1 methyltransferase [Tsuneonella sp. CC-YZS046]